MSNPLLEENALLNELMEETVLTTGKGVTVRTYPTGRVRYFSREGAAGAPETVLQVELAEEGDGRIELEWRDVPVVVDPGLLEKLCASRGVRLPVGAGKSESGKGGCMSESETQSVMGRAPGLPRYKSHKVVEALKIARIDRPMALGGGGRLQAVESGYPPIVVGPEYLAKHKPYSGGYYVRYKDGYESFSPPEAFEEGYTRVGEEVVDAAPYEAMALMIERMNQILRRQLDVSDRLLEAARTSDSLSSVECVRLAKKLEGGSG